MSLYKSEKDLSKYRVCVLVPCGSYDVPNRFMKHLANLMAYSWHCGLKVYQVGMTSRMVIHWARNELARQAKELKCPYTDETYTHILWLDDDMMFNPDLAIKLIEHDLDMVSALYFGRTKHLPVVYLNSQEPDDPYKHFPLVEVPNNLFEIDACGFGALMMKREVLDKVAYPWFEFDKGGEDIVFCVKAKKAGVKIYCDATYKLGHLTEQAAISEDTYKRYLEAHPELHEKKRVSLNGVSEALSLASPTL